MTRASATSLHAHFAETRILEAAMDVFSKAAPGDVRVEDLIQAAGISRRTFYKYFDGQDAVLEGLYELVTGKLLELTGALSVGGLDAIHLAIDAYFEFHVTNGALLHHLMEQATRSGSRLHARRRWFEIEQVKVLDAVVRRAGGPAREPMLYRALLAMLEGLSLRLLAEGAAPADVATAKRIVHELTDTLLAPSRAE